jgi:hypothetical protein
MTNGAVETFNCHRPGADASPRGSASTTDLVRISSPRRSGSPARRLVEPVCCGTMSEVAIPLPPDAGRGPGVFGRYWAWSRSLPGHGWWVPFALLAALIVWGHAVLWASGRLPVGTFNANVAILAVYGPYSLFAVSLGIVVAQRALVAFWPATGWPDDARAGWARAFATTPAGLGWIGIVAGIVGGVGSMLLAPPEVLGADRGPIPAYLAYGPAFLLGYGLAPIGVGQVIHWLRLVDRIHREARAINPFDDGPLFAFSRLTVASGLSFEGSVYYSLTVNGAFQAGNVISILFLSMSTIFGIVVFLGPLWGIHDRLVKEKETRILKAEQRLDRLTAELDERIDSGTLEGTDRINAAVSAATVLRERVARLPTWPWSPQLLRGFVSALLLPIVVYLATRLISVPLGG